MLLIIVKSPDGEILGLIRPTPQTKTSPPPWIATRPDENVSGSCPDFWAALSYVKNEPGLFDKIDHFAVSREMMAKDSGPFCHTLTLGF